MATTDKFLKLEDVFEFSYPAGPRHTGYWLFVRERGTVTGSYFDYLRGIRRPKKPIVFDVKMGRSETDVLGNASGMCIVSNEVIQLWKAENITGWDTFPVQIFDRTGNSLSKRYSGITVKGRAGKLDYNRSGAKTYLDENDEEVILSMEAIYFDLRKWDGSDIFLLDDGNWVLVTRRVIDLMKREKLTGWLATPIKKFKA